LVGRRQGSSWYYHAITKRPASGCAAVNFREGALRNRWHRIVAYLTASRSASVRLDASALAKHREIILFMTPGSVGYNSPTAMADHRRRYRAYPSVVQGRAGGDYDTPYPFTKTDYGRVSAEKVLMAIISFEWFKGQHQAGPIALWCAKPKAYGSAHRFSSISPGRAILKVHCARCPDMAKLVRRKRT